MTASEVCEPVPPPCLQEGFAEASRRAGQNKVGYGRAGQGRPRKGRAGVAAQGRERQSVVILGVQSFVRPCHTECEMAPMISPASTTAL